MWIKPTSYKIKKKTKSYDWIKKEGKLGGKGYLKKSDRTRHAILNKCVKEYGYRSCLGSLMVLNRNTKIKKYHGKKIDDDKKWLMMKYNPKSSRLI